jgi:hypothetical protein
MGDYVEVENDDIDTYTTQEKKTFAHDALLGVKKKRHAHDRDLIRLQNRILITGVIGIVVAWFYIRLSMIEQVYKDQFELYNNASSHFNSSPKPLGMTKFTIREVAIASQFPTFYSNILVTTMSAKSLSPVGAQFLLVMLTRFSDDITRETWSGSSEQLQLARLHTDAGGFLHDFDNWNVNENKFRWLCKTQKEFDTHIAVQCRLRASNGGMGNLADQTLNAITKVGDDATDPGDQARPTYDILQTLYSGGLCEVARFHVSANTEVAELVSKVAGRMSLRHVDCSAQRRMQAAGTVSNVAGAGMTGLGVVMAQSGSLFAGPISAAATLGIVAGTFVAGHFLGKRTYNSTICTPPSGASMVSKEEYTYDDLTCGSG